MAFADDRIFTLDVARGVAAICVVIYHWSLFFYVSQYGASPEIYPLHDFFASVYKNGWLGADFFFVLSGAIFFAKYARTIADGGITAREFFVLRFSRLAPLHYATLLLTALFQAILILQLGRFVLYRENLDEWHFLANLLFVQDWGFFPFLSDISFNAPAWSLSIEAFLYICFFVLLRYISANIFCFLSIAAAGLWLIHSGANVMLGRGLWCFFAGGSIAWFYTQPARAHRRKPELYGAAILLFLFVIFKSHPSPDASSGATGPDIETVSYVLHTGFFAFLVGCLAFSDRILRPVTKPLSFLGDISYSSYLLHYPLQLAFILLVVMLNGTFVSELFRSPWTMLLFFVVLVATSLLSFHYFEVPFRKSLRLSLLSEKKPLPESAAS